MNRKQKRNKKAFKCAKWIIDSVLKLPLENLEDFKKMLENEIQKRRKKDV